VPGLGPGVSKPATDPRDRRPHGELGDWRECIVVRHRGEHTPTRNPLLGRQGIALAALKLASTASTISGSVSPACNVQLRRAARYRIGVDHPSWSGPGGS
jgi:hypothetical protein